MIRFRCPHCKAKLGVPDGTAGKRGKCPHCGEVAVVPFQSEVDEPASEKPAEKQTSAPQQPTSSRPDSPLDRGKSSRSQPSRDKPSPSTEPEQEHVADDLAALAGALGGDAPIAPPKREETPKPKRQESPTARKPSAAQVKSQAAPEPAPSTTRSYSRAAPRKMRSHHRAKVNTTAMMILVGVAWLAPAIIPWAMQAGPQGEIELIFSWSLLAPGFKTVGSPGFLLLIPGMAVLGLVTLLLGAILKDADQAVSMLILGGVALLIQALALVLLAVFPEQIPAIISNSYAVHATMHFVGTLVFLAPVLTLINVRAIIPQSGVPRVLLAVASGLGLLSLLVPFILGIMVLIGTSGNALSGIVQLYLGLVLIFLTLILFAGFLLSLLDLFLPRNHLIRYAALTLYLAFVALILHVMVFPVITSGNGGSMLMVLHLGIAMFGGLCLMLGGGTVGLVFARKQAMLAEAESANAT